MSAHEPALVGAVLAGGSSGRYGSPKARALLAGRTLLSHAIGTLSLAGLEVVVIANRASDLPGRVRWGAGGEGTVSLPDAVGGARQIAVRTDLARGAGPLAGLQSALRWAVGRGASGVFLMGCDMPLVPPAVVQLVAARYDGSTVVAPASGGPLGVEPLCAAYPVSLLDEVARRLEQGHRAMGDLVSSLGPSVVPTAELAEVADPGTAFLNVNTQADRDRAEAMLREGPSAVADTTAGAGEEPE